MIIFDTFLIFKKITHSIHRSIVGKNSLKKNNYSPRYDTISEKIPKIIWIYWHAPLLDAPDVVQLSVGSWRNFNPGWTINFVTNETVNNYVTIPSPQGPRKIQWRADVIRVALLSTYGGVWADATSICLKPLDEWLPQMMETGFFAFPEIYPGRTMANNFLASAPNNYLMAKWSFLSQRYWQKKGNLRHYFWSMHLFEFILRTDKRARDIWEKTPKFHSKGAMLLKRKLTNPDLYHSPPSTVDLGSIPWLKISSSTKVPPEIMSILQSNHLIDVDALQKIFTADFVWRE